MTMHKHSLRVLALTSVALMASPGFSSAKDGDGRVQRTGDCSANSNWKLKAKPDDGRLEVEFEVDQNRNGVRWSVVLKRNGNTSLETTRATRAPSGSFTVEKRMRNGAGQDKISAVASRGDSETCRASLRI